MLLSWGDKFPGKQAATHQLSLFESGVKKLECARLKPERVTTFEKCARWSVKLAIMASRRVSSNISPSGYESETCCCDSDDLSGSDLNARGASEAVDIPDWRTHSPSPVNARHEANSVARYLLTVHSRKCPSAYKFAITLPLTFDTIARWIEHKLTQCHRREYTVKTALLLALHPKNSINWAFKETGQRPSHHHVILGLALNLRMHPFTWWEIDAAGQMLLSYDEYKSMQACNARLLMRRRRRQLDWNTWKGAPWGLEARADTGAMDAAATLVAFHKTAVHFGARRYRLVQKLPRLKSKLDATQQGNQDGGSCKDE